LSEVEDYRLEVSRRAVLKFASVAVAVAKVNGFGWGGASAAAAAAQSELDAGMVATLEAFSDTIVPGEKRSPADRAIAGAAAGPGAVQAGALVVLQMPEAGVVAELPRAAMGLNAHAAGYAAGRGIALDPAVPPFVALRFPYRTALVHQLTTPGHPEQASWAGLALLIGLAFDSAVHLDTTTAMAEGHPGLLTLGFPEPNPDGLWRFPVFSYRRQLARLSSHTAPSGSPA
jgi:hypothetical protein